MLFAALKDKKNTDGDMKINLYFNQLRLNYLKNQKKKKKKKKRPEKNIFNTNSELSQNRTEKKKSCHSKL